MIKLAMEEIYENGEISELVWYAQAPSWKILEVAIKLINKQMLKEQEKSQEIKKG